MINVIRSWGDSLKLLRPSSLKEWGLSILKGTLETYKILFKYCWWSLLLTISSDMYYQFLSRQRPMFAMARSADDGRLQVVFWGSFFCISLWYLCCFLAVRPSITKKDLKYFAGYWAHCLVALCFYILFIILLLFAAYFFRSLFLINLLYLFLIVILFFLFDTQLSFYAIFKSIWRGMKLVWYVLPLGVFICLILQAIDDSAMLFFEFGLKKVIWAYVLFPVYLNMLMYIYHKQIHEHPERYQ